MAGSSCGSFEEYIAISSANYRRLIFAISAGSISSALYVASSKSIAQILILSSMALVLLVIYHGGGLMAVRGGTQYYQITGSTLQDISIVILFFMSLMCNVAAVFFTAGTTLAICIISLLIMLLSIKSLFIFIDEIITDPKDSLPFDWEQDYFEQGEEWESDGDWENRWNDG